MDTADVVDWYIDKIEVITGMSTSPAYVVYRRMLLTASSGRR